MSTAWDFHVRYWGTTGSLATALRGDAILDKVVRAMTAMIRGRALDGLTAETVDEGEVRRRVVERVSFADRSTYGRNTTCIEVATPEQVLIVDLGSGCRDLGNALTERWNAAPAAPRQAHVLLTHAHLDHICGAPFFDPLYDDRNQVTLWGTSETLAALRSLIDPDSEMRERYCPATLPMMHGLAGMRPIPPDGNWEIGSTRIRTSSLSHPGGAVAYRLDRGARSVVIATDHEQVDHFDRGLGEFARGADLLYADAQYRADEYDGRRGFAGQPGLPRVGWGHSPVEAVVRIAMSAEVRTLHLGHHEPLRSDDELTRFLAHARQQLNLAAEQCGASPCDLQLAYEGFEWQV